MGCYALALCSFINAQKENVLLQVKTKANFNPQTVAKMLEYEKDCT